MRRYEPRKVAAPYPSHQQSLVFLDREPFREHDRYQRRHNETAETPHGGSGRLDGRQRTGSDANGINAGISFLAPTAELFQFAIWIALKFLVAINAQSMYVDKAVAKIRAARAQRIPVREWEAHLQLIGGVSHLGTFLGIALIVAEGIVTFMIFRGLGYI